MDFYSNNVQSRASAAGYDLGMRAYMQRVYTYMAGALALSGAVAFMVGSNEALLNLFFATPLKWVVLLAPLGVVLFLSARLHSMSVQAAQTTFWVYSALMGVSLASIFALYTGVSIARTFFVTASTFGALSLYGYTTKKDLSGFGTFLFIGLVGIVIASLVNLFLRSPGLEFALSIAGVLVFAGLTAYDTQRIKEQYAYSGGGAEAVAKLAVFGALTLYLDFINLFIMLLRFMGDRR